MVAKSNYVRVDFPFYCRKNLKLYAYFSKIQVNDVNRAISADTMSSLAKDADEVCIEHTEKKQIKYIWKCNFVRIESLNIK